MLPAAAAKAPGRQIPRKLSNRMFRQGPASVQFDAQDLETDCPPICSTCVGPGHRGFQAMTPLHRPTRILVVEDNDLARKQLQQLLQALPNFEVDAVAD